MITTLEVRYRVSFELITNWNCQTGCISHCYLFV